MPAKTAPRGWAWKTKEVTTPEVATASPNGPETSSVPGQGNFPTSPKYLAPPMPWPEWRHITDQELWDIAAYFKHGVKPVRNRVLDSDGPPDFWATEYTPEKIGPYPLPPFPTVREVLPQ